MKKEIEKRGQHNVSTSREIISELQQYLVDNADGVNIVKGRVTDLFPLKHTFADQLYLNNSPAQSYNSMHSKLHMARPIIIGYSVQPINSKSEAELGFIVFEVSAAVEVEGEEWDRPGPYRCRFVLGFIVVWSSLSSCFPCSNRTTYASSPHQILLDAIAINPRGICAWCFHGGSQH